MRRQIHHIAHNVWRPPFLPRVSVFRPHPVFRPPPPPVRIFRAPPPPPIRIFRAPFIRRGKGDIWLQGKDKKWVDVNDVGTFNYLTDPVSKYSIDIQLTKKYKYATFVTGVAIKAKGKIILGNNKGEISIDGELVHHHAAYFDFNQDGKNFKLDEAPGTFEFRGLGKEKFSIKWESDEKAYSIAIGTIETDHEGLFVNPETPEKYIISEENSVFKEYVPFEKIITPEPTDDQKKGAEKCCSSLKEPTLTQCKTDFERTNKCFDYYFEDKLHVRK